VTDQDSTLLVLHVIRVRGYVKPEGIEEGSGLQRAVIDEILEALERDGAAEAKTGRIEGWRLTPQGKTTHERLLAQEGDNDPAVRARLEAAYDQTFSALNSTFKEICTAWQLRDSNTINDHADAAYDAQVIERLTELHEQVRKLCSQIAVDLPRLATYESRLDHCLVRVQSGDRDSFARPLAGSYHDVWMELHEDLLLTLNRPRTAADA
jgi:hypothetical protein